MKNLTLLIPAKEESESLPRVLDELKNYNYHINVILREDDNLTIKSINNFQIKIIYQKNNGYGDALIEGINNCTTDYYCIFNADGSFNPNEISKMMYKINNENYDFVFASRYEKFAGSEDDTIITFVGNFIFTLIGKIFFKLKITDILYTYVIGNTDKTKSLNLENKDFRLCVELPIKANRKKFRITTFPSYERKRIAGKKKVNAFKDGFLILKELIRIY